MLQPQPTTARFVGGPLDGETHVLAHSLPFVQVPGPDETFFARLWAERPDCPDHLLYEVDGADTAEEALVYRCVADATGPAAGDGSTGADEPGPSSSPGGTA
ncbi:unannotated protein [freshwater metagenome]|uniref:Unannotated protein n=1 Tax=freshwater metagenome TaxID=449393 RepID=A0A6J7JXS6_9ZZZZ|nr:hypothetical protein [Actinomycetota bacterium]